MDFLNPRKTIIITLKGTLLVDKEEVILINCVKDGNEIVLTD
jgi:hypothetical protein